MTRDDLDYPAILRALDSEQGLQAYLDEKRQRREAAAQPAIGPGVTLVVAFLLAFAAMLVLAFVLEVMP